MWSMLKAVLRRERVHLGGVVCDKNMQVTKLCEWTYAFNIQ